MKDGHTVVNINSIGSTKKIMDGKFLELLSMVNKYKEIVENTKNIYDTESGTLYRMISIGYIELIEEYLNNDLKPFIDKLDDIKSIYIDECSAIAHSVHGGTKWKKII